MFSYIMYIILGKLILFKRNIVIKYFQMILQNLAKTSKLRQTNLNPSLLLNSLINPHHENEQLLQLITEYEEQQENTQQITQEQVTQKQKEKDKYRNKDNIGTRNSLHEKLSIHSIQNKVQVDLDINNIADVCMESFVKNNIKPVRMFKDRMELVKENLEKKQIVKQLEDVNQKLKLQYDLSLNNNKKMEMFLKQIQFIFKNDRSNQKANETLLKATKTLHRQKQQSKNYIQKLVKKTKTNEMRQLKTYIKVLQLQKNRLSELLSKEIINNEKLRKLEDFNNSQMKNFEFYQQVMTRILSAGLQDSLRIRQCYKKQKSMIKISLSCKQVQYIKREISTTDKQICSQLLRKQGLQYEIHLLKSRTKQKNKRNLKQQGSLLKEQIKRKHKRILNLQQQLKSKIKTQQYITRYTKELRVELEELKQNHLIAKEQYEEEINKLSREIEEWNRKYKAELIQEQNVGKKGFVKEVERVGNKKGVERAIRVIKLHQIDRLRKRILFYLIENQIDSLLFIKQSLLDSSQTISLNKLNKRLRQLQALESEPSTQVFKLARYIVQDNNQTYTKINPEQTIESCLAFIILKNLFDYPITHLNLANTLSDICSLLSKNYDEIRHQIWLNSGKSQTFTLVNLRNSFAKYISDESRINRFIAYCEYALWKKFGEMETFQLINFERSCEIILGKKLVKDSHRMSKFTIRSIFDELIKKMHYCKW